MFQIDTAQLLIILTGAFSAMSAVVIALWRTLVKREEDRVNDAKREIEERLNDARRETAEARRERDSFKLERDEVRRQLYSVIGLTDRLAGAMEQSQEMGVLPRAVDERLRRLEQESRLEAERRIRERS